MALWGAEKAEWVIADCFQLQAIFIITNLYAEIFINSKFRDCHLGKSCTSHVTECSAQILQPFKWEQDAEESGPPINYQLSFISMNTETTSVGTTTSSECSKMKNKINLYLLKHHLFQQLLWSMETNSKLSTAFALFDFPVITWGEGKRHLEYCTGCSGQHGCILLGRLTASRDPEGISAIQQEHFSP